MSKYVDGFVVPVPKKNMTEYKKMARLASKVWRDHGAIDYVEAVAEDVPYGKTTSFPRSVKLKKGETVIFSWVTYKSRKHRDQVMKKVMKDPRLESWADSKDMPFDGKRMIWGGFQKFIDISK